ncbi:hypothetical protein IMF27_07455 [Pseudomonas sp. PCH199]|uniref:hypothetical protein n=2 Tax=unclassified Pseudomonas TaxID=196821 RepID=UPI000BD923F3|nr:hypothetical protein [Pseudomonas sp. ERMR1:02]MCW8275557.1 hypothetical protein [Pseudomonas sp. PCH199]PAM84433.1 hypothetical protein CES87_07670 [Pseudomonas sp. ERMR1:02]
MANRSKKVVISARIDPQLKDALDIAASKQNEKIVKLLEEFVEIGLGTLTLPNPFREGKIRFGNEINFLEVFEAVWDPDEVLFKLRAGAIGPEFCGETLSRQAKVVIGSEYFKGEYDLFDDLNGHTQIWGGTYDKHYVNLELVKKEWPIIESYIAFLDNNQPLVVSYEDYKKMRGLDS